MIIIVRNCKDNLEKQLSICGCQYGSIQVMQFHNPIKKIDINEATFREALSGAIIKNQNKHQLIKQKIIHNTLDKQ